MPNLNNVPTLPSYLMERLSACYSQEQTDRICAGYAAQRAVSFRVNTLKATVPAVLEQLQTAGIATTPVAWSETAFFCTDSTTEAQLQALSCYENGEIYLQSLSSMLPPIVLQPQPKQEILDMTAAPGGKTTQMAAMTQNQANIMACELHAIRAEKLKYNVEKQGAKRVTVSITDARRLSPYFSFAGCSMQRQRNAFPAHRSRSAKFLSGFGAKNSQGTACPAEKSNISAEKKSGDGLFHLLHPAGRKRRTGCSDFKDRTSGTAAHCILRHGNAATAAEPICRNAMRLPRCPI